MSDCLRTDKPPDTTSRPTQPPNLSGTGNKYRPQCGGVLRLGVKASMAHSICGFTAGKTVIPR